MKFDQGYKWFVGVVFVAGVICCFLSQHSTSAVGSSVPPSPESAVPASSYTPSTDLSNGPASQEATKLPDSASRDATQKKHEFDEYDCTLDCSGHKAGYEWAERKSISDGYDCDEAGDHYNSPSFAEGCHAYVDGESGPEDDN